MVGTVGFLNRLEVMGPVTPEVKSNGVRDLKYLRGGLGRKYYESQKRIRDARNLPLYMKYCRVGKKAQQVSWLAFIRLK